MALFASFGVLAALVTAIGGAGAAAGAATRATSPSSHSGIAADWPTPSAAIPTVTGPITGPGSPSLEVASYPLARVGYSESEFFFSGTAASYANVSPLTSNGRWTVKPVSTAAYKSRLVVVMPTDPAKFSGTVVVEWLNVSGGFDYAPDWLYGHDEMIRSGDAYVGVSVQAVGINELKSSDPARYASLVTPGDSYSYDMFSQAGMAVRDRASVLLPGLRPKIVIADGESQSATRMTTYVDAVAPLVHVFNSYMIHSRFAGSAPLSQSPQTVINTPSVVFIRSDLRRPVLTFLTETDVLALGFYPATQPDSRFFGLWEVAGTTHGDTYVTIQAADDDGSWPSDLDQFGSMTSPPSSVTVGLVTVSCPVPFNTGEQHYVFNTALRDLVRWTRSGVPPRTMPRLEVDTATTPLSFRLDQNGNVLGGIRTPAVDAPIATLSGLPPAGAPGFCILFGQTHPFTPSQISALYPTHADFVRQWQRSAYRDLAKGYLLPQDARRLADVVSVSHP